MRIIPNVKVASDEIPLPQKKKKGVSYRSIKHSLEIKDAVGSGVLTDHVSPLYYSVADEANEKICFHFFPYVEDVLVNLFFPLSAIYIYAMYGLVGLQLRSLWPPSPPAKLEMHDESTLDEKEDDEGLNTMFEDKDKPRWSMSALVFFVNGAIIGPSFRILWIALFFATKRYFIAVENINGKSHSPATVYAFYLSALFYLLNILTLSNKKAFRKKSSLARLMLHKERRHEELFWGWLPLPWQLCVFELRLAAFKVGHTDLTKKWFVFNNCTEEQLRAALGEKVLSYLEDDHELRVTAPADSGEIATGAKCSAMAMLLRIGLDHSFANPAFGPDAEGNYLSPHFSYIWTFYVLVLSALPFIVAHCIQSGGTYDVLDIASCVVSVLWIISNAVVPPQGFTYGAILSLKRRKEMLSFLNALLMVDRNKDIMPQEQANSSNSLHFDKTDKFKGEHHVDWDFQLDMKHAGNINLWHDCRDIVVEFGASFRARTDANGAIMILYVAVFTLLLVIASIVLPDKISMRSFAFPILAHIMMILPMTMFAMALAREGEECNTVADKSCHLLSSAMLHFEEEISNSSHVLSALELQRINSARNAAAQLHTSLLISKQLHPVEILRLLTLDRALIATVFSAVFVQLSLILNAITID